MRSWLGASFSKRRRVTCWLAYFLKRVSYYCPNMDFLSGLYSHSVSASVIQSDPTVVRSEAAAAAAAAESAGSSRGNGVAAGCKHVNALFFFFLRRR